MIGSRNLFVIVIVLSSLLLLGVHLSTNNLEYSRCNIDWNGTSVFFSLLDPHTCREISDLSLLTDKTNSTLLIIAPGEGYSDNEIVQVRRFVEGGNTLILADDTDVGNHLLKGIGSHIRIRPGVLASIDRAYSDSYIVTTIPIAEHPLTVRVTSLVLDKAATLIGGESLLESSIMSWIDSDLNRRISGGEMLGKQSVLAHEPFGKGEVIVLSDSSIFINSMTRMRDNWGNQKFIANLIQNRPFLLIEQVKSRTVVSEGLGEVVQIIRTQLLVKLVIIALMLLVIPCVEWYSSRRQAGEDVGNTEPYE
ncbi:MAG TPA: DUF4350 domain-containing protein [Methanospirillum sp.]|nr:DUF4350 domain-containing protein [Methanospirillum sp.]